MSDKFSNLFERIIFHYQNHSYLSQYMDIRKNDNQNFDQISYNAVLQNITIPTDEFETNDLAEQIAKGLVDYEFSHFVSSLGQVDCKTVETSLENLVNTLDDVYNELWDSSNEPDQLYLPFLLNNEIRKRKNSISQGINFLTQTLRPNIVRELGNNQIIFANRRCFDKIYPETIEQQLLLSNLMGIRYPEINCTIVQKLNFRNNNLMTKIIVSDADKLQ